MPKALQYLAFSFVLGSVLTGQAVLLGTPARSDSEAPTELQSTAQPKKNISVGRYDADPESGAVVGDIYTNAYFGLSLPLPPG